MKTRIINIFFLCLALNSSTFAAQANIEKQQEQIHDLINNNKTAEAIEFIHKNGSDEILFSAVFDAIRNGNIEVLKSVLKINPKIANIQRLFENAAAMSPNVEILKILFELGGQVNQQNEFGNTPLHNAARWYQYHNVEFLLSKGASKDLLNNEGRTPAQHAIDRFITWNRHIGINDRTSYLNQYIETLRLLGVDSDI